MEKYKIDNFVLFCSGEEKSEWVSVEDEKKPAVGKMVQLYVQGSGDKYDTIQTGHCLENGLFETRMHLTKDHKITHWAAFPKKPIQEHTRNTQ